MGDSDYKEDSTKGNSLIDPENYKGDALVQVWIDSRVLATLDRWLESCGSYPRFLSEVVRKPLDSLAAHLVDTGQVEIVDDTNQARSILEKKYRVNLNKGNKGKKNLLHNQVLTGRRIDLSRSISDGKRAARNKNVDPDEIKRAMEIFNSKEE